MRYPPFAFITHTRYSLLAFNQKKKEADYAITTGGNSGH